MSTTTFPPQSASFNFGSRGTLVPKPPVTDAAVQDDFAPLPDSTTLPVPIPDEPTTAAATQVALQPEEETMQTIEDRLKTEGDFNLRTLQDIEDFVMHSKAVSSGSDNTAKVSDSTDDLEEASVASVVSSDATEDTEFAEKAQVFSETLQESLHDMDASDSLDDAAEPSFSEMEDLYKLNPEAFGEMPTKEFRAKVKQLRALDEQIAGSETSLMKLELAVSSINTMITKKELVSESGLEEIIGVIASGLKYDEDEEIDEIREAFRTVPDEDWFDMSPRRVMEGYRMLVKSYLDQVTTAKGNLLNLRREFFAQYEK